MRFALALAVALTALPVGAASAANWAIGDVFAGVGGGVKVYDNAGNFKEHLVDNTNSFTTGGCGFDQAENLYSTTFQARSVVKYENAHPHPITGTFPSQTGNNSPESIVFDSAGNFYVGHADGAADIEMHDPSGAFVRSFDVTTDTRGSDWIELAADQRTMFYASEGPAIFRYDVVSGTQLAPFATGLPGQHFALRLLPPGDGTGGLLVAARNDIQRLDASGNIVQTYDVPNEEFWFALNLDPNGTSFWSGNILNGNFYRFNMATGAVEVGPIDTDPTGEFAGLCLLGEPTAAVPPPPSPEPPTSEACGLTIRGKTQAGTAGPETLTGTPQSDFLRGFDGEDTIEGLDDADCLRGNADADDISGGPGGDVIRAGRGGDDVSGDDGDDEIRLQDGPDTVDAGDGDDRIKAQGQRRNEGGVDKVDCGPGDDRATVDRWDRVDRSCERVTIVNAK